MREWSSYLRRAILGYVVLLLRGYETRNSILEALGDSCFDDSVGQKLREDSTVATFLTEFVAGLQSAQSASVSPNG